MRYSIKKLQSISKILWMILASRFKFKLSILKFWTKLTRKGYFKSKIKKNKRTNLGSTFQKEHLILIFLEQITNKKILPVKNEENEHPIWSIHIRINLKTKPQLKLKIWFFCTKFSQKRYFEFKAETLNTTIECCISELV